MTRTEAIAIINAQLASFDDERVLTVADIVQDMTATNDLPRPLTAEELALIERSKADFKEGRTHSSSEARTLTDAFLAKLRGSSSAV